MNTVTRLGGFALGLAVVFGAAYGVGRVADPAAPVAESRHDGAAHTPGPTGEHDEAVDRVPGGLLVSDRGYTLVPVAAPAGFRHVHPDLAADGTWRVDTPLAGPGQWRAFADFTPTGGEPLTLGVDVAVPGALTERPLPAPAASTTVDGYTVTLAGALQPGRTTALTLSIGRDGQPVTDLGPHLGAYGHLVALRRGDLAYLHVHPDGTPGDGRTRSGPTVTFLAEVPSAGSYRLYLDFRHGGAVHTAEFTVVAGTPAADAPAAGNPGGDPTPSGPAPNGAPITAPPGTGTTDGTRR